jgi:hypothetical protein
MSFDGGFETLSILKEGLSIETEIENKEQS